MLNELRHLVKEESWEVNLRFLVEEDQKEDKQTDEKESKEVPKKKR